MKWINSYKNEIPIFVYGTLKSGYENNYLLNEATFLGKAATVERMYMYSYFGHFPVVVIPISNIGKLARQIAGEVYTISFETSLNIDLLEEYPIIYNKIFTKVKIIDRKSKNSCSKMYAQIYIADPSSPIYFCPESKDQDINTNFAGVIVKNGKYEWI